MRFRVVTLACALALAPSLARGRGAETRDVTVRDGRHRARVVVRTRPFVAADHRIRGVEAYRTTVDGRLAIGSDGHVPTVEISAIELTFDGRRVPVSRRLYTDLFEPNLDPAFFSARLVRGGSVVEVRMSGSDGDGGYEVVWRLDRRGRHRRSVTTGD